VIRVLLQGRLGNHLFQIATALALAEKHATQIVVDASQLPEIVTQRKLRLLPALQFGFPRKLGSVRLNYLSKKYFDRPAYSWGGAPLYQEPSHNHDPQVVSLGPRVIIEGFFQNERYFESIAGKLREWFDLDPWLAQATPENRRACLSAGATAVHVRRTDYLNPEHRHFNVCGPAYYQQAMNRVRIASPDARFLIFSDDTEWCAHHFQAQDTLIVGPKSGAYGMLSDLALFSACKHQIIANSSFSWWGAWLNKNPDRIVLAPEQWTRDGSILTDTKRMRGLETVPSDFTATP
jgi:hypothetical protein